MIHDAFPSAFTYDVHRTRKTDLDAETAQGLPGDSAGAPFGMAK